MACIQMHGSAAEVRKMCTITAVDGAPHALAFALADFSRACCLALRSSGGWTMVQRCGVQVRSLVLCDFVLDFVY